jgi:hypothetical protein
MKEGKLKKEEQYQRPPWRCELDHKCKTRRRWEVEAEMELDARQRVSVGEEWFCVFGGLCKVHDMYNDVSPKVQTTQRRGWGIVYQYPSGFLVHGD